MTTSVCWRCKERPGVVDDGTTLECIECASATAKRTRAMLAEMDEVVRNQLRAFPRIANRVEFVRECIKQHREEAAQAANYESHIQTSLDVCKLRGWSLHWTARGAYLHLESSELIEAWRGKGKSTVAQEAGDVLLVLFSILGASKTSWNAALQCALAKMEDLKTKPRYSGEEYSVAVIDNTNRETITHGRKEG